MEIQFPSKRQMAAHHVWLNFKRFQVESLLGKPVSRLAPDRFRLNRSRFNLKRELDQYWFGSNRQIRNTGKTGGRYETEAD
jgi:hypothetical protein